MKGKELMIGCGVVVLALGIRATAQVQHQNQTRAGDPQSYATIHCIGIEWPIQGDANHNAACQVEYRKPNAAWKKALPLLRLDTDRTNGFAGSIFDLDPGTVYEVRLQLSNPDGGRQTVAFREQTRGLPAWRDGGRKFYVGPGSGGGDGSSANPFRGLDSAQAVAEPGDMVLLQPGKYGPFRFDKAGAAGRPICWKGDGEAVLAGVEVVASCLWFEGLTLRPGSADSQVGVQAAAGVSDIVFCRNQVLGFHKGIILAKGNRDWYIADNVIEGDNDPVTGGLSGEGVELGRSRGHIVAHNLIRRVADGVSYPGSDCDIFGNDIQDVSDDGVETDMGQQNIRVWGNRITNACNNVFSFQPMNRGPWYFIRNQVILTRGKIFKFSTVPDRFVVLHNTFVFPKLASEYAQCLLNSLCRNNLYIAYGEDSPMWRAAWSPRKPGRPGHTFNPDWMTDVDCDGFDWGPMTEPFLWHGKAYQNLEGFAAGVGIEKHAVRLRKEDIFEKWTMPIAQENAVPAHLPLKKGCRAVDAGALLPNINDNFVGQGPDLGALEWGRPLPNYGPRK